MAKVHDSLQLPVLPETADHGLEIAKITSTCILYTYTHRIPMGRTVHLPTMKNLNQLNVGKYTMHGSYVIC